MKKTDTLVILSPGFPENESDDTCLPERQVFVQSLKAHYPHLHLCVLSFQYPYVKKSYRWNGVEVISFGGRNKGKLARLQVWFEVWKTLSRLHKQHRLIGLLSFWLGECAFVGSRFAARYGVIHYCWLLGQDAKQNNLYVKRIKPKPQHLIALSHFLADTFYFNYGIKPAHVIPCTIDPNQFSLAETQRTIDVLGAGSLIPLKQYDVFIQVIKSLSCFLPQISAVICGKGPQMAALLQLIKEYRLEKNIILMNEIPHREVLKLMQKTKIFLHPSSYEGFGVVCLEALYAGTPVVSLCKPMNDTIANWYFANGTEQMIAQTLNLLQDPTPSFSTLPYSSKEIAAAVLKLFSYEETATS